VTIGIQRQEFAERTSVANSGSLQLADADAAQGESPGVIAL
jgi:hypothetical protein